MAEKHTDSHTDLRKLTDDITYVGDSANTLQRRLAKFRSYEGSVQSVPIGEMREKLDDIETTCDRIREQLDQLEADIE